MRRLFVVLSASVLALTGVPAVTPVAAAQVSPPGATYTALATPLRVLDTRTATGGHQGKVAAEETVALAVPGLPPDATAVVVNLTGTGATEATFLSVFPDRYTGTSTLNLGAARTAAVGTVVALDADRRTRLRNSRGSVDVVVDLVGYFARGSGAGFAATPVTRVLDTRTPTGGHQRALGPGETLSLSVRGVAGVPVDATAVLLNVTGVAPSAATYLRVTPDGRAGTSTVNLEQGTTRANVAVTGVGGDGAVRITNGVGATHVLADVLGWFGPSGTGRYVPLPGPTRVLDTRAGAPGPIAAGTSRPIAFAGAVPEFSTVVTLFSVTGVAPTARTFLTAWPRGPRPPVSTVSVAAGDTVSNTAVVPGTAAEVYNSAGSVDALVDAIGYFYTPTRPDPTVPRSPSVAVDNTGAAAHVSWQAPDDGGLPMTRYTVTLQPGARRVTVPASRTTATLDGLTVGGRYTITVSATNLAGAGPASAPTAIGPPTWVSRVDTATSGAVDPDRRTWPVAVSDDGRHVLLTARSNSVLVPAPYRTTDDRHPYLLRKDRQTGVVVLVSLVPSRVAVFGADADTVAFTGQDDHAVHVRDLATGVDRVVWTAPDAVEPTGVALSRDGHWVTWRHGDLYRHDLGTHRTEAIALCPALFADCRLVDHAPAGDGTTFAITYRSQPARVTLLNADTGATRALVITDDADTFVLSADGSRLYYRCERTCPAHTIRSIATTSGATATTRHWPAATTMTLSPHTTTADGATLGYQRQRGDGAWRQATTGWVLDTTTGREAQLPPVRDNSYLSTPFLSANGATAIAEENCLLGEPCTPTGIYAISIPALLAT
jgi:fibronectin type III domain protein